MDIHDANTLKDFPTIRPAAPTFTTTALTLRGTPRKQSSYSNTVRDLRRIKDLLMTDIENPKTSVLARAQLSRVFCLVADCERSHRGIPLPGMLRPDLDERQLKGALKRYAARKGIIQMDTAALPPTDEAPTEDDEPQDDDEGIS